MLKCEERGNGANNDNAASDTNGVVAGSLTVMGSQENIFKSSMSGSKARERLLTIGDVASWLGVSKAWVYDHVTRKKPRLPCIRFGELTRFRHEDIEQFIKGHVKSSGS